MRDAFINELARRARSDESVMLVVGDLGYGVVTDFAESMPAQFVNAGVSEQGMMSMVAGLASAGYQVFVYSIANFPTLRCLEQIRNDVAYNNLDVSIVSVGAGLAYGSLGYSHYAVEDLSIMRVLPNLRVICPADPFEAVNAVSACLSHCGPKYVRLGKNGEPNLNRLDDHLDAGTPYLLRAGSDAILVATGAIVGKCLDAAELLAMRGIHAQVWSVPTVKPLPLHWLEALDSRVPIVSVEEHVLEGGFGTALLESVNLSGIDLRIRRIGLPSGLGLRLGSQEFLREIYGLGGISIADVVMQMVSQG